MRRFKSCLCAQVCIGLNLVCVQFSPVQVINGVMSLALCLQVVSQAPQHFRSSEKQATCEGCFVRQSVCSVISLHSGMSRGQYTHRSFRRWKTVGCVYSWELKMLGFENKKSALVSITNPNTQPKTTLQAATNGLPLSHHCSSYRQTKAPLHFRH